MSFNVALGEAAWGKLLAWSALLLGLAGLALMAMFLVVLGLDLSGIDHERPVHQVRPLGRPQRRVDTDARARILELQLHRSE